MAWEELQIVLPPDRVDEVAARLAVVGLAGLQEDHLPGEAPAVRQPWDRGPAPRPAPRVLLRAWFEDPDRAAVEGALAGLPVAPRWEAVEERDWERDWKEGFAPIRVSERIVVAPPWDAPDGAVIIEPGQGFGTGQHPTTLGALRMVDELARDARTLLDVGAGSGVLAIAGAKLGLSARGVEIEEAAVRDAHANAARNGVTVDFSTADPASLAEGADLVVANIHAEELVRLADVLVRLTGRHLVLAGVLADRESRVRGAFDPRLALAERRIDGEWVLLHYRVRA